MKQKKTILARIFAGLFLLVFLTLTGLLIYGALQPETLPLGAPMPEMAFQTENGTKILHPDRAHKTLVMYFHTNCKYCRAQLRKFDENIAAFKDTHMILLTHEKNLFEKKRMRAWPYLAQAKNITWGIAGKDALLEHFAPRVTPTTYIFNKAGLLVSKIRGEAKLEKMLNALKKAGGPERRFSGQ
ncbi:MAG: TlpA family protein disulfide reductase [bacterium]